MWRSNVQVTAEFHGYHASSMSSQTSLLKNPLLKTMALNRDVFYKVFRQFIRTPNLIPGLLASIHTCKYMLQWNNSNFHCCVVTELGCRSMQRSRKSKFAMFFSGLWLKVSLWLTLLYIIKKITPLSLYVYNHRSTAITLNFSNYITAKHLGYFNHILGCLSCINVTKECYQIGFLESSLRSSFSSITAYWLHSWHYYHNHATKELSMTAV